MTGAAGSFVDGGGRAPRWLLLVALACIAVPQAAALLSLPVVLTNDSVWYLDQTHTWDSPRPTDYFAADGKPTRYALLYPPGYPLFLDLCHLLVPTERWARAVVGVQHVLSFATALLLYGIGRGLGRPTAGAVAAALYGLYFPRLLYAHTLLSETLFAFLLALSAYLSLASLRGSTRLAALAGLGFAAAAMTKFQGAVAIPLVLALYAASRARPAQAVAFATAAACSAGLAVLHNYVAYDYAGLTTFSGRHLANKVFGSDRLVDASDPDTRYILDQLAASSIPHSFPDCWWGYERALRSDGSSSAEADRRIRAAAFAGIRKDPWRYARNAGRTLFVNVFANDDLDVTRFWTRERFAGYLASWTRLSSGAASPLEIEARARVLAGIDVDPPPARLGSAGLAWMRVFSSPPLRWRGMAAWLLVGGILCAAASGSAGGVFLAALVVGASLPGALAEFPVPRYSEPLIPLALLAACSGLPAQLTARGVARWIGLAALLVGVAALGLLFEPAIRGYLWVGGPAAAFVSGAALWRSVESARRLGAAGALAGALLLASIAVTVHGAPGR